MRLIDADAFKENIGTETKLRKMICSAIDTQPTAYDVGNEYNKAIDDFAEMVCDKVESFTATVNGVRADILTIDYLTEFVFEIAEQLKG